MVRPVEFDRETVLKEAMRVFWAKGFAATSTDDLTEAMGIGRQSLYNAFGDKRRLYLAALAHYQQESVASHVRRLTNPSSPIAGIQALLLGLVVDDDEERSLGCMGVGAACEFGVSDPELVRLRQQSRPLLHARLIERLREGQAAREIDSEMDANEAASFIEMTMTGIQLAARAGASAKELRKIARFALSRLKNR